MSNESILMGLAIVFSIITALYIKKYKMTAGSILLLLYSFCSWGSYIYYNTGVVFLFSPIVDLNIEGFLYLLLVLFIFFMPILKFSPFKYENISIIDQSQFLTVVKILFWIEVFLIIVYFPSLVDAMSGDLGDNRNMIYEGESFIKVKNPLIIMLSRLAGGIKQLSIPIAIYGILFYRKEKYVLPFLFVSIFYPIMVSLMWIMRSQVMLTCLYLIFLVFLFKPFIPVDKWKMIMRVGPIGGLGAFIILQMISVSRFGDMVWAYFFRYWGESFINFNNLLYGHLKGNTMGSACFPTFAKLLGQYGAEDNEQKYDLISNVCGLDGGIFYTYVGNLCMEFGYKLTVLFASIICIVTYNYLYKKHFSLTLPHLLVVSYFGWQFMYGVFCAGFQGGSNWEIIELLLLCWYLSKLNYKTVSISEYYNY